jgi:hypothetical protein
VTNIDLKHVLVEYLGAALQAQFSDAFRGFLVKVGTEFHPHGVSPEFLCSQDYDTPVP